MEDLGLIHELPDQEQTALALPLWGTLRGNGRRTVDWAAVVVHEDIEAYPIERHVDSQGSRVIRIGMS